MSRVLIVVPPLTGHVNPTVGLGEELKARGHHVAWAGLPGVVDELLPQRASFLPVVGSLSVAAVEEMHRRGSGLRGAEALKFLWEGFIIPYAEATTGALCEAARAFEPDVMVVDQQAIGGAVAARLLGVPWVTSASTSAELTAPLAALPRVADWVRAKMSDLQIGLGVDPERAVGSDLRFSDLLVLAYTTQELVGEVTVPSGPVRFVGPCIAPRGDPTPFPWEWLDPRRRHVLVTLGTVNQEMGRRFFAAAVEAASAAGVQAVLVAPRELLGALPAGDLVWVQPKIPQLELLGQMDAVVTHGGHNTVCESLALGLPLVLAPIRDDQPIIADQVVRAGAGVRVKFGRVTAAELGEALSSVLECPSYREAAATIRRSFSEAGGALAAADAVEEVLARDLAVSLTCDAC